MAKVNLTRSLQWILMVFLSPIALLILVLLVLFSLLGFLYKVALLFAIVAINTPFAVMYNVSTVVVQYYFRVQSIADFASKPSADKWKRSDPRVSVGADVQILVSDFLKTVAAELLVAVSAGVITFYTAPIKAFYISMTVGVAVVFHKWLNTESSSKAALSCLCGGYGLNPMMILFSFIGLFDIGGHPVAKCTFAAEKAFLFVEKDSHLQKNCTDPRHYRIVPENGISDWKPRPQDDYKEEICHHQFSEMDVINVEQGECTLVIDSFHWNAFDHRGCFQLIPKIVFQNLAGNYVLESFMVLRFLDHFVCNYPMERLELPEDYSKPSELYHFLAILASNDAFVTDKLRGRYEYSLTLSQIAEGVEKNAGFKIVRPKDKVFVVAGCTNKCRQEGQD